MKTIKDIVFVAFWVILMLGTLFGVFALLRGIFVTEWQLFGFPAWLVGLVVFIVCAFTEIIWIAKIAEPVESLEE